VAFDLLRLDGEGLRLRLIEARREALMPFRQRPWGCKFVKRFAGRLDAERAGMEALPLTPEAAGAARAFCPANASAR
jgi:hypothetical protein